MKKSFFHYYLFLFALILAAPQGAQAQALGPGFATQSVFLSSSAPAAGQNLLVYASVSNTSTTTFSGTALFSDGSVEIGHVSVSLTPGQASLASVPWIPTAGEHTITASLEDLAGAVVASQSERFSIPASAAGLGTTASSETFYQYVATSSAFESSQPIDSAVASVSPAAAKAISPILQIIDSARERAADFLDAQIAHTLPKLAASSTPSLADARQVNAGGIENSIASVPWTLYFYLLVAARFVVAQFIVFYPLLVVLFFFILYKLYRHMNRPKWAR